MGRRTRGRAVALGRAVSGAFLRAPYVGGRGWVGVYLDVEQDWDDVAEIIEAAYLEVAPVTLRRAWTQRDG